MNADERGFEKKGLRFKVFGNCETVSQFWERVIKSPIIVLVPENKIEYEDDLRFEKGWGLTIDVLWEVGRLGTCHGRV